MRIDPLRPASPVSTAKPSATGEASTFRQLVNPEPAASPRATGTHLLSPSLTLLAEEPPSERRRRDAARGKRLIGKLDALRRSLLAGKRVARELAQLASEIAATERPLDADLAAMFDEMAIRVAVELAKREA